MEAQADSLRGRIALVTGASRGIGAAIALRLAAAGADAAIGYARNREAAQAVAGQVRALGRKAIMVGGDLAEPEANLRLIEAVERELGMLDILICNAGVGQRQDLAEISVADWDTVMHINLRSAFLLAQRALPGMRERRWGRVVFVSSVAAFTGGILEQPTKSRGRHGLCGGSRSCVPIHPT